MDGKTLNIVFAMVHLREGPEAVALGAASVASAVGASLPQKSDVSIRIQENFLEETPDAIMDAILAHEPGIIGFSLYSWNRRLFTDTARRIRIRHPHILLFCGGPEATALPRGLVREDGGPFDVVIRGEGESGAARLINGFLAGERIPPLIKDPPPDSAELAALPSPWLDGTLAVGEGGGVLWELGRGCPYGCAYCYESKGEKRIRYFPEERIEAELRVFSRGNAASVFVLDPTFNADGDRARRLLQMISEIAPEPHWHFEVRAELLNKDQARRFAALGASLQIGLQSSNPRVCSLIGRGFNRERFERGIGFLHGAGVAFGLDIIYGLPGDSLAAYRKTLDYALSLYPDNLDMFRLSVLPGTVLFDRAEELGIGFEPEAPYEVVRTQGFSENDLATAEGLSRATDLFYNRGRAVAWFNQILYPLSAKPSAFLSGFGEFMEKPSLPLRRGGGTGSNRSGHAALSSIEIESLQLGYLDMVYGRARKEQLLPVVWDLVRLHGAWGRALAEGISTRISCNYDPRLLLEAGAFDIEDFAVDTETSPALIEIRAGEGEPELVDL